MRLEAANEKRGGFNGPDACIFRSGLGCSAALLALVGCGSKAAAGYETAQAVASAAKMNDCSPDLMPTKYATSSVACLDTMVEWYPSSAALRASLKDELIPGVTPDTILSGSNWLLICDSQSTCLKYRVRLGGMLSPTTGGGDPLIARLSPTRQGSKQPGAQHIVAGACPHAIGAYAVIDIDPDTPAPRCEAVSAWQQLEIVNNTDGFGLKGRPVTVRWADYPSVTIQPRHSLIFVGQFGSYLGGGDHEPAISLYGGGGPEIYLQDRTHTDGDR